MIKSKLVNIVSDQTWQNWIIKPQTQMFRIWKKKCKIRNTNADQETHFSPNLFSISFSAASLSNLIDGSGAGGLETSPLSTKNEYSQCAPNLKVNQTYGQKTL